MQCPFCGDDGNRVIDSRIARDGAEIRRRRECDECGRRFTTRGELGAYERETFEVVVLGGGGGEVVLVLVLGGGGTVVTPVVDGPSLESPVTSASKPGINKSRTPIPHVIRCWQIAANCPWM